MLDGPRWGCQQPSFTRAKARFVSPMHYGTNFGTLPYARGPYPAERFAFRGILPAPDAQDAVRMG